MVLTTLVQAHSLYFSPPLSTSPYFFSLYLSLFLLSLPLLISSFHVSFLIERVFVLDEVSLLLCFLTILVLFLSYFFSLSSRGRRVILILMLVPCILVFSVRDFFILYLFYEISLLPILFIILKWGSYPERSVSALMLLLYTSVFTMPLLGCVFRLGASLGSFSTVLLSRRPLSHLVTLVIFFSFAVKLPVYGLHFWLPMAHVEAPTFGSMILAGVLLKLGGVGLLRFLPLLDVFFLRSCLLSYFLLFFFFTSLVCCFQSDFKRLVAYSSVSHIIALPLLLIRNVDLISKAMIRAIFFHGLSSPIMFMLVGIIYSLFGTRQLALTRGLILISPLLSFIIILSFFYTLSAPPYPSFFAEVLFFVSVFSVSNYTLFTFLLFIFFSLVYNLNWLSSILFSSVTSISSRKTIPYCVILPLVVAHLFSILVLFLIPLL